MMLPNDPGGRRAMPRSTLIRPAPMRTAPTKRRDPAPSRFSYRIQRLLLTPVYRKLIRIGLPAFLCAMIAGIWLSNEDRRASLTAGMNGIVENIQHRDAFMVKMMKIEGASPVVDAGLRAMLPVDLPASSFDINLDQLRAQVMRLDAVESIELRIRQDVLYAVVKERVPAVLWRHARGMEILDRTGHRVASVTARDVRSDLPVIAGERADKAAAEALALIDAAGPILPRLRGLERMGERRWDLVLDRGQRIQLPETNPVRALERAIALDKADALLARDVSVLDLRDGSRPTLRLGLDAQNRIRAARGLPEIGPDGQVIETTEPGAKPAKKG